MHPSRNFVLRNYMYLQLWLFTQQSRLFFCFFIDIDKVVSGFSLVEIPIFSSLMLLTVSTWAEHILCPSPYSNIFSQSFFASMTTQLKKVPSLNIISSIKFCSILYPSMIHVQFCLRIKFLSLILSDVFITQATKNSEVADFGLLPCLNL